MVWLADDAADLANDLSKANIDGVLFSRQRKGLFGGQLHLHFMMVFFLQIQKLLCCQHYCALQQVLHSQARDYTSSLP